jgi:hypothetical protein
MTPGRWIAVIIVLLIALSAVNYLVFHNHSIAINAETQRQLSMQLSRFRPDKTPWRSARHSGTTILASRYVFTPTLNRVLRPRWRAQ